MGNLTDTGLKTIKSKDKDFVLTDGEGLQIVIKANGKKLWEFIYSSPSHFKEDGKKKRRKSTFGYYPQTTLKTARDKAKSFNDLILNGIDPLDKKEDDKREAMKRDKSNFKLIADEWLEFEAKRTTPETHIRKKRIVEKDGYPYLATKSINDITHKDIIEVLKKRLNKKIANADDNDHPCDGIETTNKLYNYLNTIFKYAITLGLCDKNPFNDILKDLIIPKANTIHHKKITDTIELKKLINDIYSYNGHYSISNALKFCLHIPLRASNLANLKWSYINFDDNSLTIPRHLMKNKNSNLPDFKVPLSDTVIEILEHQKNFTNHQDFIFLSVNNKPLNEDSPNMALVRLGYKNSQKLHGFRGVFRSLADTLQKEHNLDYEVKKRFLDHHDDNKVELAYNHRAEYFEQMKPLVKWWSNYLESLRD